MSNDIQGDSFETQDLATAFFLVVVESLFFFRNVATNKKFSLIEVS